MGSRLRGNDLLLMYGIILQLVSFAFLGLLMVSLLNTLPSVRERVPRRPLLYPPISFQQAPQVPA